MQSNYGRVQHFGTITLKNIKQVKTFEDKKDNKD